LPRKDIEKQQHCESF